MSERRACRLLEIARATARYLPHPAQEGPLPEELKQLKGRYPRFGIRRAHALLRSDGQVINHKRVQRLWHKHGLQVSQRPKKRKIKTGRAVACQAQHPDHVWSYDFQADALLSGRAVRLLSVLDELGFYWGHALPVVHTTGYTSDQVGAAAVVAGEGLSYHERRLPNNSSWDTTVALMEAPHGEGNLGS